MLLIGEGTADIQRMIIGRRLLEEYAARGMIRVISRRPRLPGQVHPTRSYFDRLGHEHAAQRLEPGPRPTSTSSTRCRSGRSRSTRRPRSSSTPVRQGVPGPELPHRRHRPQAAGAHHRPPHLGTGAARRRPLRDLARAVRRADLRAVRPAGRQRGPDRALDRRCSAPCSGWCGRRARMRSPAASVTSARSASSCRAVRGARRAQVRPAGARHPRRLPGPAARATAYVPTAGMRRTREASCPAAQLSSLPPTA